MAAARCYWRGRARTAPPANRPVAPAQPAKAPDSVLGVLRAVISEKTGYPVEALGEDLALDADLGIDSIKRVEILAGVQERLPDAPAVTPDQMGTLRTLRQLAGHLSGSQATLAPTTPEKKTTLERHELIFEPWTIENGPNLLPPGSRVLLAGDFPDLARELELAARWRIDKVNDPSEIKCPLDGLVLAPSMPPGADLAWETTRWLQAAAAAWGIPDAKLREVVVAGTGNDSSSYVFPTLLNRMLGMKFKVVAGYMSSGEVDSAVIEPVGAGPASTKRTRSHASRILAIHWMRSRTKR